MSVTLFGIGLAAVLACAAFVAYWYGWRFAKMLFYSATVNALGATIVYTLGLPKMVSTIVTAVSCSVFFSSSCTQPRMPCHYPTGASYGNSSSFAPTPYL